MAQVTRSQVYVVIQPKTQITRSQVYVVIQPKTQITRSQVYVVLTEKAKKKPVVNFGYFPEAS